MIVHRRHEPRRQRQHNGSAERHRVADFSEQKSAFGVAIVGLELDYVNKLIVI